MGSCRWTISGQGSILVAGGADEAGSNIEWKKRQMPSVVCAVEEAGSEEAVRAAIDSCVEHGADLRLVGIVADKLTDSTRATGGERVRRYNTVRFRLERAADAARKKGVVATAVVRVGDPFEELLEEANTVGSGELFFVRTRGRIRAALTGQPRRELAHVSLGASYVRELARVA